MADPFSRRLPWDAPQNRLTAAIGARRAAGAEILDLTVSNPTEVGFAAPEELLRLLADPRGARYQPHPRGHREARAAIARTYRARGAAVDPDHVVLGASTSEAYAWLLKLLCDPGDAVLVPRPSYPLIEPLAALEGARLLPYKLRYDRRWRVDVASIEAQAAKARAVVIVSPHNPTGARLRRDDLARLARLGPPLVCDEVFADYAEDDPACVETAAEAREGLVFALGGLSKSAALPQLKLAWIAVAGAPALRDAALARLDLVADTYLSAETPVQLAAPKLLRAARARRDAVRARLAANAAALPECAAPWHGGWYIILRAPRGRSDEDWALALLEHDGVLVHPGYFYDFDAEGLLVASLLPDERVFAEAMRRIGARFDAGK